MALLMPSMVLDHVNDISMEVIKRLNVKAIILDIDNTIAAHGSSELFEGTNDWLKMLKGENIKIIICSNNFKSRVSPIAEKLELPFISFSMKPFGLGFIRAKKTLKEKGRNILVIGDQIFTDILGANLFKMKSILLVPQSDNEPLSVKFRRKFEKRIRNKIRG